MPDDTAAPSPRVAPAEEPARRQAVRFVRGHAELGLRLVAAVILVAVAGRTLFAEWTAALAVSSPYRALGTVVPAAVGVAAWRQLCRPDELAVNDRHVDAITSIGTVAVAVALTSQLSPRLRDLAGAARLDVLSGPLLLFALLCALFGTRPTWRHRHAIVLTFLAWPLPYNLGASIIPAANFGWWILSVILTVATVSVMDAPGRRGALGGAAGLLVGLTIAQVRNPLGGPAALIASLVTTVILARLLRVSWLRLRERPRAIFARRSLPPVVDESVWIAPLLVAASLVAALAPATPNPQLIQRAPAGSVGATGSPACPSLTGWAPTGSARSGQPNEVDSLAVLGCRYRNTMTSDPPFMEVRLSDPVPTSTLVQFPWESTNQVIGTQQPTVQRVALIAGVTGWGLVFDDASRPLTTVVVTWDWAMPGSHHSLARRVSVIMNDDPRPDSPFPTPRFHLASTLARRLQQVLRTNLTRSVRYQVKAKNLPAAVAAAQAAAVQLAAPASAAP